METELSDNRNRRRAGGIVFGRRGVGTGGGLQAKMQSLYQQPTVYQKQFDALVAEIQDALDGEQREKLSDVKLLEHKMPEIGRRCGTGGNPRRGGGGRFGVLDE